MKITGPGQVSNSSGPKKTKKSGDGAAFARELESGQETGAAGRTQASQPLSSVGGLIGLQEVGTASDGRSKGLQRAEDMLDMLEEVRKGLLLGAIPEGRLRILADMARNQQGRSDDSRLNEILGDIELRAEVELAKLGR
ncbi:flagellar assembly protein FliX [Yunchengibacter salinarum]|uniref:flagellar assembly protein FliX n=1 Tax=Yunchengibacter salinarum TaxID=3133399 RepID=UPI0035B58C7F